MTKKYDAVVVGTGPNGISAAIAIQQVGLSVLLVEGEDIVGGGVKSAELMIPGVIHDICSAIHPLAVGSPFLKTLPLNSSKKTSPYPSPCDCWGLRFPTSKIPIRSRASN